MSFWDYIRVTLQTQLEEGNYEQAWADLLEIKELESNRDFTEDYWNWDAKGLCAALSQRKDELALKDVEGSAHALASNYGRMKALSGDANVQIIKDLCSHHGVKVDIKTKPAFSLVKRLKKVLKRYELLEDISSTVWRNSKTKSMKNLVNYLNLVDVCNQSSSTEE